MALAPPQRREDPLPGRRAAAAAATRSTARVATQGQRAFTQYCAACHGADQRGAIPGVPVARRRDRPHRRGELARHRQRGPQQHAADPRRVQRGDPGDLSPICRSRTRTVGAAEVGRGRGGGRGPPLPPGPVVAQRRRAASAAAAALRRAVLSGRRRHGGQHALAGGRRGGEAADALPDRLQRHGDGDQAAVHDHHRLRPEHRRDQVAGAERRRSRQRSITSARATARTIPAASAPATAWS